MTDPIEDSGFEAEKNGYQESCSNVNYETQRTIPHTPPYSLNLVKKCLHKIIVYPFLNDDSGSRYTRLSRSDERRKGYTIYRRRKVSIVKHNDRGLIMGSAGVLLVAMKKPTLPPSSAVNAAKLAPTMAPNARPVCVPAFEYKFLT